jgi:serine/threonine-protein kinase PRP4
MPEFGYKEGHRQGRERNSSRSRSGDRDHKKRSKDDKKTKKEGKRKRSRTDADDVEVVDKGPTEVATPREREPRREPPRDDRQRVSSWREEIEKTDAAEEEDDDPVADGGIVAMETDEDVERKLAESRARREALIAKWVNRGEDGQMIQFENTNTPLQDEEAGSDNEEVTAFFEAKKKELEKEKDGMDDKAKEERRAVNRYILQARAAEEGDMFGEDGEAQKALNTGVSQAAAIGQTGASGDDWNDAEGYYKAKIGELMDERYRVTEDMCGKGTFSNVIKAQDQTNKMQVAIKVMRCNDMMRKAAEKEIELLERLRAADKENKRNVIRLFRTFVYRNHLCLVFECMWDNLRVALKKYTKDKGMSLKAVRAYTRQLLIALQHIHRMQIIHADIKPDNILISAGCRC